MNASYFIIRIVTEKVMIQKKVGNIQEKLQEYYGGDKYCKYKTPTLKILKYLINLKEKTAETH